MCCVRNRLEVIQDQKSYKSLLKPDILAISILKENEAVLLREKLATVVKTRNEQ